MATKRKEYLYYEADFETTTGAYASDQTRVWLYYIENIFNEGDNSLGVNIDTFFSFLESRTKDTVVYFHNLNFDGEFLLNYLVDEYKYKRSNVGKYQTKLEAGEFTNMSDGVSSHYVIQFKTKSRNIRIKFLCSYKQLMTSVAGLMNIGQDKEKIDYDITNLPLTVSELTQRQIIYVKKDVKAVIPYMSALITKYDKSIGITSSGTAMKMVKHNINDVLDKTRYDRYFKNKIHTGFFDKNMVWHEGEWDYFKKGYQGGYTTLGLDVVGHIWRHIEVYDVNSMYPYNMRNQRLPVGEPLNCKKTNCNHLKFLEINLDFKLKPMGVPFIAEKTGYSQHIDYLSEGTNHVIYITDAMWKTINKWYDVSRYEIINQIHFMGVENLFTDYIDEYQAMKQSAIKGSFEYLFSKLMQNQVYGKFGMSPKRKKMYLRDYDPEKDKRKNIVLYGRTHKMVWDYDWDVSEPAYIPMALWITSYSRAQIADFINTVNPLCTCYRKKGCFLYADTDSAHLTICAEHKAQLENFAPIHPTKLGYFDNEKSKRLGFYLKRKFYFEFDYPSELVNPKDTGSAGIDKENMRQYTYKQIWNREWKAIKTQKSKVMGGIILRKKEVSIYGND